MSIVFESNGETSGAVADGAFNIMSHPVFEYLGLSPSDTSNSNTMGTSRGWLQHLGLCHSHGKLGLSFWSPALAQLCPSGGEEGTMSVCLSKDKKINSKKVVCPFFFFP